MLITTIQKTLTEFICVLNQITQEEFCLPFANLSDATIGGHTRHIIELFQCLDEQFEGGIINYDSRKRDYSIQSSIENAKLAMETISRNLEKENKNLLIQQVVGSELLTVSSNYNRELMYNLEHCIHHQALIKVALLQLDSITFNENFGVAPSTIEYRKQCAQ